MKSIEGVECGFFFEESIKKFLDKAPGPYVSIFRTSLKDGITVFHRIRDAIVSEKPQLICPGFIGISILDQDEENGTEFKIFSSNKQDIDVNSKLSKWVLLHSSVKTEIRKVFYDSLFIGKFFNSHRFTVFLEIEGSPRQELVRLFGIDPFCYYATLITEILVKDGRSSRFEIVAVDYLPKEHDQEILARTSTLFAPSYFSELAAHFTPLQSLPRGATLFKAPSAGHVKPKKVLLELKDGQTGLITAGYPKIDENAKISMADYVRCYFYPSVLKVLVASMDFSKAPILPIKWKLVSIPANSKGTSRPFTTERGHFNTVFNEISLRYLTSPEHHLWIARDDVILEEKPPSFEFVLTYSFTAECIQNYLASLFTHTISSARLKIGCYTSKILVRTDSKEKDRYLIRWYFTTQSISKNLLNDFRKALLLNHKLSNAKDEWPDISIMASQQTADGPILKEYIATPLTCVDFHYDIRDHVFEIKWQEYAKPTGISLSKTPKSKKQADSNLIWSDTVLENGPVGCQPFEADAPIRLYSLSDIFYE